MRKSVIGQAERVLQELRRVEVLDPLAAVLQLLGERLAARQAGRRPDWRALREVLVLEQALAARLRGQPLGELALDGDAAAVGPVERHVDGRRIAGQACRQRLLEREPCPAGPGDAERLQERRLVAAAPIPEHVHDERRRRAQRVQACRACRARRELRAALKFREIRAVERRAQIVVELAHARVRVVTHAVRVGPAPLRAQQSGSCRSPRAEPRDAVASAPRPRAHGAGRSPSVSSTTVPHGSTIVATSSPSAWSRRNGDASLIPLASSSAQNARRFRTSKPT